MNIPSVGAQLLVEFGDLAEGSLDIRGSSLESGVWSQVEVSMIRSS